MIRSEFGPTLYQDWFLCKTAEEIDDKVDEARQNLCLRMVMDKRRPLEGTEVIEVMDGEIPAVARAMGFVHARIVHVETTTGAPPEEPRP